MLLGAALAFAALPLNLPAIPGPRQNLQFRVDRKGEDVIAREPSAFHRGENVFFDRHREFALAA